MGQIERGRVDTSLQTRNACVLQEFEHELCLAFEQPTSQFRARANVFALRQGKQDIHTYAQRSRYLVSSILTDTLAQEIQVVTFNDWA